MSGSNLAVIEQPLDDASLPATSTPNDAPRAPHYDDPDDQERREALAAVEAERQAAAGAPATPPAKPAAPVTPPVTPPAATDEVMIPKARLDDALRRVQQAETALAYREGQLALLQQAGAPAPSAPEQAAPSPQELEAAQAREIEEQWGQAWTDYETGAITGAEKGAREVALLSRVIALNMGRVLRDAQAWTAQFVQSQAPAVGVVDQEVMRAHVDRLEAEHPWSRDLGEREAAALIQMARVEAQALGRPFPQGLAGTMALQKRVAELASIYMPQWRQGQEPPVNPQPRAATPPAAPAAPAPRQSPTGPTRADVQEAMRRQAALPPNTPGAHGANSGPITLDRIDTMTDDELERMPKAERHRLLGIIS